MEDRQVWVAGSSLIKSFPQTNARRHMHTRTHTRTHAHALPHARPHARTLARTHTHTQTHAHRPQTHTRMHSPHTHSHIDTHAYTRTRLHAHKQTDTHTYTQHKHTVGDPIFGSNKMCALTCDLAKSALISEYSKTESCVVSIICMFVLFDFLIGMRRIRVNIYLAVMY